MAFREVPQKGTGTLIPTYNIGVFHVSHVFSSSLPFLSIYFYILLNTSPMHLIIELIKFIFTWNTSGQIN